MKFEMSPTSRLRRLEYKDRYGDTVKFDVFRGRVYVSINDGFPSSVSLSIKRFNKIARRVNNEVEDQEDGII